MAIATASRRAIAPSASRIASATSPGASFKWWSRELIARSIPTSLKRRAAAMGIATSGSSSARNKTAGLVSHGQSAPASRPANWLPKLTRCRLQPLQGFHCPGPRSALRPSCASNSATSRAAPGDSTRGPPRKLVPPSSASWPLASSRRRGTTQTSPVAATAVTATRRSEGDPAASTRREWPESRQTLGGFRGGSTRLQCRSTAPALVRSSATPTRRRGFRIVPTAAEAAAVSFVLRRSGSTSPSASAKLGMPEQRPQPLLGGAHAQVHSQRLVVPHGVRRRDRPLDLAAGDVRVAFGKDPNFLLSRAGDSILERGEAIHLRRSTDRRAGELHPVVDGGDPQHVSGMSPIAPGKWVVQLPGWRRGRA